LTSRPSRLSPIRTVRFDVEPEPRLTWGNRGVHGQAAFQLLIRAVAREADRYEYQLTGHGPAVADGHSLACELLESHGIVVLRLPMHTADADAFSDRPILVFGTDKKDRARSRLGAASPVRHGRTWWPLPVSAVVNSASVDSLSSATTSSATRMPRTVRPPHLPHSHTPHKSRTQTPDVERLIAERNPWVTFRCPGFHPWRSVGAPWVLGRHRPRSTDGTRRHVVPPSTRTKYPRFGLASTSGTR
jgi:hypothetical protein